MEVTAVVEAAEADTEAVVRAEAEAKADAVADALLAEEARRRWRRRTLP